VQTIYQDGSYLSSNPTWHEEDAPWKAMQIDKIVKRNHLNLQSICEVGCGSGEVLKELSTMWSDIHLFQGYDISPQAFNICHSKATDRLQFALKDLLEENVSFDLVMAIDVFEHIEDYFTFLRRLKPKAKYKIFHIPLDLSSQSVLRGAPLLDARVKVGHIHYFTKDTALATLEETGFTILDYFYTGRSLDLASQSWKTNLLKIPRQILFSLNPDLAVRLLGGFSLIVLAK
jgi:2-polyprenyl-3-methyl-5-hydroxy-6-metoxy-1,4-benzoquinol methylase